MRAPPPPSVSTFKTPALPSSCGPPPPAPLLFVLPAQLAKQKDSVEHAAVERTTAAPPTRTANAPRSVFIDRSSRPSDSSFFAVVSQERARRRARREAPRGSSYVAAPSRRNRRPPSRARTR